MSKILQLSNGIFLPSVEDIYIFIDDAGVINTDFLGFTSLMIDEFTNRNIAEKVKEFCIKNSIINLHARELKINGVEDGQLDMNEYERIYRDLFEIVITEFEKSNFIILVNLLTNQSLNQNLYNNHHNLFNQTTNNLIISSLPSLYNNFYSFFAFPTVEIIRRIKNCDEGISIKVFIDRKDNFETINNQSIFLKGSNASVLFKLNEVAVKVFNAYVNQAFQNNCKINSLNIVASVNNPLINVVDAFCNFSYNYAKVVIQGTGNSRPTELRKYNVFRDLLINRIGINISEVEQRETLIRNNFQFYSGRIVSTTNREVSTFEISH
ncbi:MAG: hypothetical protein IPM14_05080 [bacterium]|nr:hypothetical protein [bacterium]